RGATIRGRGTEGPWALALSRLAMTGSVAIWSHWPGKEYGLRIFGASGGREQSPSALRQIDKTGSRFWVMESVVHEAVVCCSSLFLNYYCLRACPQQIVIDYLCSKSLHGYDT